MQFYAVFSEFNLRIILTDIILRLEAAYWLDRQIDCALKLEDIVMSKDKRGQA